MIAVMSFIGRGPPAAGCLLGPQCRKRATPGTGQVARFRVPGLGVRTGGCTILGRLLASAPRDGARQAERLRLLINRQPLDRNRSLPLTLPATRYPLITNPLFMAFDPRLIDDLARRLAGSVPESVAALRRDLEQNFKGVLSGGLARLDLVTREEFDVQAAVLKRTRAKLAALEKRLAELEGKG